VEAIESKSTSSPFAVGSPFASQGGSYQLFLEVFSKKICEPLKTEEPALTSFKTVLVGDELLLLELFKTEK
jgi:hypothetical protein